MHLAVAQLKIVPEHIIVDGNRFYPYKNIAHTCIVKGDGKYYSIAAASILAKTYRDEYMIELDKKENRYGYAKHKGYPTKVHRAAIRKFGVTDDHRLTFRLLDEQMEIDFNV
jgi:ribonuclease HII